MEEGIAVFNISSCCHGVCRAVMLSGEDLGSPLRTKPIGKASWLWAQNDGRAYTKTYDLQSICMGLSTLLPAWAVDGEGNVELAGAALRIWSEDWDCWGEVPRRE